MKYRRAFLPPLSLAVLGGLTPARHEVSCVNDLVEDIDFDGDFDLVGITAMTSQAHRAYEIARRFRNRGVPVILGGAHPTILPQEAARHADSVLVGEAEHLWEEVLADAEKRSLKPRYQDGSLPDLSLSPAPDWRGFNLEIYPRRFGSRLPMMPIFTTRGCPMGCKFCSVTKLYGRCYRTKPVARVVSEIADSGATELFFVDDNIACLPEYSRELFKALSGKGIRWMSQVSTTVLRHPELIDLAARSGCFYLFVGVESLNRSSLDGARKSFNRVEAYAELIDRMRSAGIVPYLSFIFGFDEDTEEQFEEVFSFLRQNRVGFAAFWILTPLPGTDLYDEMVSEGRLASSDWSRFDGTNVVFATRCMPPHDLAQRFWAANLRLYAASSLVRHTAYNVAASREKVEELLRNVFYQTLFRKKVLAGEHPFSGGVGAPLKRTGAL